MGRHRSGPRRHSTRSQPVRLGAGWFQPIHHDDGRQPVHVPIGYPHFSGKTKLCMCLFECCMGPAGCRCRECPCNGNHVFVDQRNGKVRRRVCFACGDPATTRIEGEPACRDCKADYEREYA